jgi:hypothetical protein
MNRVLFTQPAGGPFIIQQTLDSWDSETIALVKKVVMEYKKYRSLIRSGKVYHLIAPSGKVVHRVR